MQLQLMFLLSRPISTFFHFAHFNFPLFVLTKLNLILSTVAMIFGGRMQWAGDFVETASSIFWHDFNQCFPSYSAYRLRRFLDGRGEIQRIWHGLLLNLTRNPEDFLLRGDFNIALRWKCWLIVPLVSCKVTMLFAFTLRLRPDVEGSLKLISLLVVNKTNEQPDGFSDKQNDPFNPDPVVRLSRPESSASIIAILMEFVRFFPFLLQVFMA